MSGKFIKAKSIKLQTSLRVDLSDVADRIRKNNAGIALMKIYSHWSKFPMNEWRWSSFKPSELRSKSHKKLAIDERSMDKLQELRDLLNRPLYITSAYRSPEHNKKVNGAKNSLHMKAKAFDIQMWNQDTDEFVRLAKKVGFKGFGYYPNSRKPFIHIDTGRARSWGTSWTQDNRNAKKVTTPPWLIDLIEVLLRAFVKFIERLLR